MPEVTVRSAKRGDKAVIEDMLQAYLGEFAKFEQVEQDEDGQFIYPYLDFYWEDPNRYPFLLCTENELAGFALCRFEVDPVSGREQMEMAEFFVKPEFRRTGVGREAAAWLWNLFPGRWIVRVLKSNKRAMPFWETVIGEYTNGSFDQQPPSTPIGGAVSFTFESSTSAALPDDVEQDFLDDF